MIGIIAANNIRFSSYILYYTRILDKIGVSYELIYPDRMNVVDSFSSTEYVLPWNKKLPVIFAYYFYTQRVKTIVRKKNYSLLIVLTTNNVVYLATWLKKNYYKRYILDIRDYTHENNPLYYALEKRGIYHSLLNVISCKRFKSFLPSGEYIVCHNMNSADIVDDPVIKQEQPITIGYIGKGAYLEQCIKICEKVRYDSRFKFAFYGISEIPKDLAAFQQYKNIDFHGLFTPSEKPSIIRSVDILFNAYGNGSQLLDCSLSNKLYDALSYGKPILTSPGTYLSEIAGPFGFDVDFTKETFLDDLYKWYTNLNVEILISFARKTLEKFKIESQQTEDIIISEIRNSL